MKRFTGRGKTTSKTSPSETSQTFEHLHGDSQRLVGLLLVNTNGVGHDHLAEAALAQRFTQSQPEAKPPVEPNRLGSFSVLLISFSHRVRGNSHLGSGGSSSSETLASIGPSLDDRRAILTSGVLEFMEELESKDTCLGSKRKLLSFRKKGAMTCE